MDFERTTWRAFQQLFPNAILRGCAFHWTQSLFRNLKKIGLVPVCRSNRVQILCKRAMSLHLLPPTKIVKLFPKLNKVSVRFGQKFYANQTFFFIWLGHWPNNTFFFVGFGQWPNHTFSKYCIQPTNYFFIFSATFFL